MIGERMAEALGQPVVIENKPGASGLIAAEMVAKASPDGHTLLLNTTATWAILPHVRKTLPYDPAKSFAAVSMLATADNVMVVSKNHRAKTLVEFIQYAKANPDKVNYGSAGIASPAHLAGEMLSLYAKLTMNHVPYKGAAPALTDMVGGLIDFIITSPISADPQVRNGSAIVLGTTGGKRNPAFPQIPTIGEVVPGYEISQSWGILAPSGVPREILSRIQIVIEATLKRPDVVEKIRAMGAIPVGGSMADFDAYMVQERKRMGELIGRTGITLAD
jgi:tripartite-type tricarboxylate transporter receptor subunit TctC